MSQEFGPDDLDVSHSPFIERLKRKPGLRWWQWTGLGLMIFALLMVSIGAYLFLHLQCRVRCGGPAPDSPFAPLNGEAPGLAPFNALLVGSDSREGLTEEEMESYGADEVPGERADTLIVAHIDPQENTVVMVQFPRDLYVPVAGRGSAKINSALEDGPENLLDTMRIVTGLKFQHYAQVNIAGFRDIIDAIDGVDVCITEPIPFDKQTGIEISEDELGMVHFDGERALRYVRSRAFPSGDFERIANQQKFVSAAIDKVTSVSTFFRPDRLIGLYDAAGDNLRTDSETTLGKLLNIADRLQSFDPETYEAYIVPNLGNGSNEAGAVILPDYDTMEVLFDAIAANRSPQEADGVPDIDPSTIDVAVYNSGYPGGAADAASQLEAATTMDEASLNVVTEGDSAEQHAYTFVRYAPEAREMAELVAAAIDGVVLEEAPTEAGVDVEVYPGRLFATQRIIQLRPLELPVPSEPPAECR